MPPAARHGPCRPDTRHSRSTAAMHVTACAPAATWPPGELTHGSGSRREALLLLLLLRLLPLLVVFVLAVTGAEGSRRETKRGPQERGATCPASSAQQRTWPCVKGHF